MLAMTSYHLSQAGGAVVGVKTTNGSARTPFFLTRNEYIFAAERPKEWRIYRVHLFATERRIFVVAPPLEQSLSLRTETWRASFVNRWIRLVRHLEVVAPLARWFAEHDIRARCARVLFRNWG